MSGFDEWYKEENWGPAFGDNGDFHYGASVVWDYKQTEIDSLNKNIESLHIENERIQREYQMTFDNLRGRQQTIDALQEAANREREQATEYYTDFHCAIAERDALQKRIDDALNELCRLQYASAERVYHDVSKILKGDKND